MNDFKDGKYTPPHGEEQFQLKVVDAKRKYLAELVNFGHEKSSVWEQKERKLRKCQEKLKLRDKEFQSDEEKSQLKKETNSLSRQLDAEKHEREKERLESQHKFDELKSNMSRLQQDLQQQKTECVADRNHNRRGVKAEVASTLLKGASDITTTLLQKLLK